MAEKTNIAWTDATFNPWLGCTKVSPGCDGCYAAVSTPARTLGVLWGHDQPRRRTSFSNWMKPKRWNDLAARGLMPDGKTPTNGRRPRVFCASLADVFDLEVENAWRDELFAVIDETPNLDWLLLTKRIGNVAKWMHWAGADELPPNVWLGASIVNQEEADRDIPKLLATPAAKRFVSYEPALGPVDFVSAVNQVCRHDGGYMEGDTGAWICRQCENETEMPGLDWIIVGGESAQPGHPARPFDIAWARDTVRQCREAAVPCFVKQMGSAAEWNCTDPDAEPPYWGALKYRDRAGADPAEWPSDLRVREFPA